MKNVLIYTNHFYPENFNINEVAFGLSERGIKVTVISCVPNYPNGRFFERYGIFRKSRQTINGLNVIRLPLIPRGNGSKLRIILEYLTYSFSTIVHSLLIGFGKKYDLILVYHVSPVFIAIPAIIVKKIQRTKLIFWNLDLWPEIVVANTGLRSPVFFKILLRLVKWINKNVDLMLIASKGYKKLMMERNLLDNQIVHFPNWPNKIFFENNNIKIPFDFPQGFNIVYAGNIGNSQDFENVLKAIEILKNEEINWIFVGDGRKKVWLEDKIEKLNLASKVYFPGQLPLEYMPTLFRNADLLLSSLVDEPIFTIPLKVTTYLSSATPIVCMMNGEGGELIEELKCGKSCPAGDFVSLANNILALYKLPHDELNQLGKNGYDYCMKFLNPEKSIEKLFQLIKKQ